MIVDIFKKYLEKLNNNTITTSLSRSISNNIIDFFINNYSKVNSISNDTIILTKGISSVLNLESYPKDNLNINIELYNLRTNKTFNSTVIDYSTDIVTIQLDDINTDIEIEDKLYDLTDYYSSINTQTPEIIKLRNYSTPKYAKNQWLDLQGLHYNTPRFLLSDISYTDLLQYYPLAHFSGKSLMVKHILSLLFIQNMSKINFFNNPTLKRTFELIYNQNYRISSDYELGIDHSKEYVFTIPEVPTSDSPTKIAQDDIEATLIKGISENNYIGSPYVVNNNVYMPQYYITDTLNSISNVSISVPLDTKNKTNYRNLFPLQYSYLIHKSQNNSIYLLAPSKITKSGFINNKPYLQWEPISIEKTYIKGTIIEEILPKDPTQLDSTNIYNWDFPPIKRYFFNTVINNYTSLNTYIQPIGIIVYFLTKVSVDILNEHYGPLFPVDNSLSLGTSQILPTNNNIISYNKYDDLSIMPSLKSDIFKIDNSFNNGNLPPINNKYTIEFSYLLNTVQRNLPKTILTINTTQQTIDLLTINKDRQLILNYIDSSNNLIQQNTNIKIDPLVQYNYTITVDELIGTINLFINGSLIHSWSSLSINLVNSVIDNYSFNLKNSTLDNIRLTNSILYTSNYTNSTESPDMFISLNTDTNNEVLRILFNDIYLSDITSSTTSNIKANIHNLNYRIGFYENNNIYYIINKGIIHIIS